MERVFEISEDEKVYRIRVKATLGAARIYRTEFNRDLVSDLTELNAAMNDGVERALLKALEGKNIDLSNADAVTAALTESTDWITLTKERPPTFEELERSGNVLWAFAKNADGSIPGTETWIGAMDVMLPMKEIIGKLYELWTRSSGTTVTLKNA